MHHFTVSSPNNLEKAQPARYSQAYSVRRNDYLPPYYRQSPRQSHTGTFSSQKLMGLKHAPYANAQSAYKPCRVEQNVQKALFNDHSTISKTRATGTSYNNKEIVHSNKEGTRPKIVFSYKKMEIEKEQEKNVQAKRTEKKQQNFERYRQQLTFLTIKNQLRKQKLKICSNQFNYSILAQNILKKVHKYSSISSNKIANLYKKFNNCSQSMNLVHKKTAIKNNQSKIGSTQATRSFQIQNDLSEAIFSSEAKSNWEHIENDSQIKGFSLVDKIQPSKLLKKTLVISNYDFGGILSHQSGSRKKQSQNKIQDLGNQKWRSYVRCLFEDNQELKSSIHCGPDIRLNQEKCEILTGFGRQIEQSGFSEQDLFQ